MTPDKASRTSLYCSVKVKDQIVTPYQLILSVFYPGSVSGLKIVIVHASVLTSAYSTKHSKELTWGSLTPTRPPLTRQRSGRTGIGAGAFLADGVGSVWEMTEQTAARVASPNWHHGFVQANPA